MVKCLININGTEYATVMNNYVLAKLEEHGTSLDAVLNDDALTSQSVVLLTYSFQTLRPLHQKPFNLQLMDWWLGV